MTAPLAPQYDPSDIEAPLYAWWQERGLFRPEAVPGGGRAVRHHDAAAERHGGAPRRSRAQQHGAGRPGPLRADAGAARALAAGHRPRRHRHAERGRAAARQGRAHPLRPRPRGVRGAGLGLRGPDRRPDPRTAQGHRLLGRLVAHVLHAGRGSLPRRARGVRPAVRGGARLPRPLHHQLVPALSHRPLQRGGGEGGDRRAALAPPLPAGRRQRSHHRRHHPARRPCWAIPRSRCIRTTSATAPSSAGSCSAAGGGPPHPGRRGRRRGSRVRLRRGEGDAGARPRRLRDRPPPPASQHRRDDARGADEPRGARAVPGTRPLRGPEARGRRVRVARACWRRWSATGTRWATATAATR